MDASVVLSALQISLLLFLIMDGSTSGNRWTMILLPAAIASFATFVYRSTLSIRISLIINIAVVALFASSWIVMLIIKRDTWLYRGFEGYSAAALGGIIVCAIPCVLIWTSAMILTNREWPKSY